MNIILKENQYKVLIFETIKNKFKSKIEEDKSLIEKIVSDVKKDFNLDLKFILTYSVTIAGLINPVYELMSKNYPKIDSSDLSLITVGVIMTYYYNNLELLNKILILIRDKELVDEFENMLSKTEIIKKRFFEFINSLNISLSSFSNILAFTFLLGVLEVLLSFSQTGFSQLELDKFVIGLSGYFATLATKSTIEKLIYKIIKRFSKN